MAQTVCYPDWFAWSRTVTCFAAHVSFLSSIKQRKAVKISFNSWFIWDLRLLFQSKSAPTLERWAMVPSEYTNSNMWIHFQTSRQRVPVIRKQLSLAETDISSAASKTNALIKLLFNLIMHTYMKNNISNWLTKNHWIPVVVWLAPLRNVISIFYSKKYML